MLFKLFLISYAILGDFSYINALQWTGEGVCVATEGGVFLYKPQEGIVFARKIEGVRLAAMERTSGKIAFLRYDNTLSIYDTFQNNISFVKKLNFKVKALGYQLNRLILVREDGDTICLTEIGGESQIKGFNPMYLSRRLDSFIPAYVKAHVYKDPCGHFYKLNSVLNTPEYIYAGTDGYGLFIFTKFGNYAIDSVLIKFDRIEKVARDGESLYLIHADGISVIGKGKFWTIPAICLSQKVIDVMDSNSLLSPEAVISSTFPFMERYDIPETCGEAIRSINKQAFLTEHCVIDRENGEFRIFYKSPYQLEDAYLYPDKEKLALIENSVLKLVSIKGIKEVVYEDEPIYGYRLVGVEDSVFVFAKRGVFLITAERVQRLWRIGFDLASIKDIERINDTFFITFPFFIGYFSYTDAKWGKINIPYSTVRCYDLKGFGVIDKGKHVVAYSNCVLIY